MFTNRPYTRRTAIFCLAAGTLLFPAALLAQEPTGGAHQFGTTLTGPVGGDQLGMALAALDDLNADGVHEYAVGLPGSDHAGYGFGAVQIHDGATDALLLTVGGSVAFGDFGNALSPCGDIDGDGFGDLLVGARLTDDPVSGAQYAGAAHVISTATGLELARVHGDLEWGFLGENVAGIGDVDGDGIPDLVTSHTGFDGVAGINSGAVQLHSGADGSLIRRFEGPTASGQFSYGLGSFPDRNGDGIEEVLVGAYLEDSNGLINNGVVYLLSGSDGLVLQRIDGDLSLAASGTSVAHAGDVNGDGVEDILIGAPQFGIQPGYAEVRSGLDGAMIHRLQGGFQLGALFGNGVYPAGDINGDGIADAAVGAWREDGFRGTMYFFSGADGSLMQRVPGPTDAVSFGISFAALNAPSMSRTFLVGAPHTDDGISSQSGKAHRVTVDPMLTPSATSISAAAGGTVTYHVDFPDQYAGHKAVLVASIQGSGFTFENGVGFPIGPTNLLNRTTITPWPGAVAVLDGMGNASIPMTFQPGELLQGLGKHIEICAAGVGPIGSLPLVASTQASLVILP